MDEDILRTVTEKCYQDITQDTDLAISLLAEHSKEMQGFLPPDLHSRLGEFLELRDFLRHQARCRGEEKP